MAKARRAFDVEYVICCDDIRSEVGGKDSLMGVFGKDVVMGRIPGVLRTFAFRISGILREPTASMSVVFRSPSGKIVMRANGILEATTELPAPAVLNLPGGPVNFTESGEYELSIAVNEGRLKKIHSLTVHEGSPVQG